MIENNRASLEIHVPAHLNTQKAALAFVDKRVNAFLNAMSSLRAMAQADCDDTLSLPQTVTMHIHIRVFTLFNNHIGKEDVLRQVEAHHAETEFMVLSVPDNAVAPLNGQTVDENICVIQVY